MILAINKQLTANMNNLISELRRFNIITQKAELKYKDFRNYSFLYELPVEVKNATISCIYVGIDLQTNLEYYGYRYLTSKGTLDRNYYLTITKLLLSIERNGLK